MLPSTAPQSDPSQQVMQCMEIWGGIEPVDTSVVMPGLDAWVYSRPYGGARAGGDVHYVSSCATGRVTRLLVADVSGHGAAVCDTAGELRRLMRRYVNYIDQTRFVRSMNRRFRQFASAACFATAVVTTFYAPNNHLSLCNAGHPPPLLYRAATRTWSFLREVDDAIAEDSDDPPADLPLGVTDRASYGEFEVVLDVGDLVLCYTDSLIESRGPDGELLGPEGLLVIVQGLDVSEPARLIPGLLAAVEAKSSGNLAADDVTALLFRPNGQAQTVPVRERFLAPFRVMRGLIASLRPGKAAGPMPWPELTVANIGGAMFAPLARVWRGARRRGTPPHGLDG